MSTSVWQKLGQDIAGEFGGDLSARVSLSADGTRVAIGARMNDGTTGTSTDNRGHVRVYDYKLDTVDQTYKWAQVGDDIDGAAAGDYSGHSVSLSADGTCVAIGAIYNDDGGILSDNRGHVRVYTYINSAWTQVGSSITGLAAGDQCGVSVSLSADGTYVAIGAHLNDGTGTAADNRGHVRVYTYINSAWTQVGSSITGIASSVWSGFSVSLSTNGTRVAIGAPTEGANSKMNSGSVRVYDLVSGVWTQVGGLIGGEYAMDYSAEAISLSADGTCVAIGSIWNNGIPGTSGSQKRGHARVYKNINSVWTQLGTDLDGEATNDYHGYSVSLSANGTRVAVGATQNDTPVTSTSDNRGNVRIYDYKLDTVDQTYKWSEVGGEIIGSTAVDTSGYSVSLSADGARVAIGTLNGDTTGKNNCGIVRVYELPTSAVTVPGAPTIGTAVLGSNSGEVKVYFTAPGSNGGATINNYTVIPSSGIAQTATASPYTFTGLTPGTGYSFTVVANNSAGPSAASGSSNFVTLPTAPGAPTDVTAVRGDSGEAIVSFTAPSSNGGATITEYIASSNPVGFSKSGTTVSPLTVTGLTNGISYTFTVVAKNSAGLSSADSGSSNPVIPLNASAASLQTLKGISDAGISAIMNTLLAAPIVNGSVVDIVALGMPHPNTGVDLEEKKRINKQIINTIFENKPLLTSFKVKSSDLAIPAENVKENLIIVKNVANLTSSPFVLDGIMNSTTGVYAALENMGDINKFSFGSKTYTIVKTSLTEYTFTNSAGSSQTCVEGQKLEFDGLVLIFGGGSFSQNPLPGAPTDVTAFPANGSATVNFTAPTYTGTSPITEYTVTSSSGTAQIATASPYMFTGLTNGIEYTFTVKANNSSGPSDASGVSNLVTPATVPDVPTGVAASRNNNGEIFVEFTPPTNTGGSAITNYTVTSSNGIGRTATESPFLFPDLPVGTLVTFTVKANNSAGPSDPSSISNSVTTPTYPDAPTGVTATAYDGLVSIAFTPPANNGGAPILGYTVLYNGDTPTEVLGTSSPIEITGLTIGTQYTFSVFTRNMMGPSPTSDEVTLTMPAVTVSDAPTIDSIDVTTNSATVNFSAPANTGGSAILSYTVRGSSGNNPVVNLTDITVSASASPLQAVFTGLSEDTDYEFTVIAVNGVGPSVSSIQMGGHTTTTQAAITKPTAPVIYSVEIIGTDFKLTFTPPMNDGGAAIESYTLTTTKGNETPITTSNVTVNNLTADSGYITIPFTTSSTEITYKIELQAYNGTELSNSASINMAVDAVILPPSVSITADKTTINSGQSVTFTSTLINAGEIIPTYQWYIGNTSVGLDSATFTTTSLADGDSVSVVLSVEGGASITSNNVTITVTAPLVPSVTIDATARTIVSGTSVTFTATPVNGGSNPSYQWHIGNTVVPGQNSATFTTSSLANNDSVFANLTDSDGVVLATAYSIVMTVTAPSGPSVTITVDKPIIVSREPVTFTATPVNGGSSPTYIWYLGNTPFSSNSATFTRSDLFIGDYLVYVELSSNGVVVATSNIITMTPLQPSVSITADKTTINSGQSVTFTATPINGGLTPVYYWYNNGTYIAGQTNTAIFTTTPLADGTVYAILSSYGQLSQSNNVTITVNSGEQSTGSAGSSGSVNKAIEVNFAVNVDANGEIVILGASALSLENVIVAETNLPVSALYTTTDSMFEFYEPSSEVGVIYGELSSVTGDYKKLTHSLENGLHACIKGKFSAINIPDPTNAPTVSTIAAPFNDAKYTANAEQYRKANSFGDLALASIAHHLMGHVAATAAITNDKAFVDAMNSSPYVAYDAAGLLIADNYAATDVTGSTTDAKLAKGLVKKIASKLPADVNTIARQVIGKDASRAMDQDNNQLPVNTRHRLKFIAGDVIYMNIKLQKPDVVVSSGQKVSDSTLEGKFPTVSGTTTNYTLKITLS